MLSIHIQRSEVGVNCTRGYLLTQVDGEDKPTVTCYVMEPRPVADVPGITTIPSGTYAVTVREDGPRGWRLELADVPGWANVQLHVGNYPEDTVGCLLPGTTAPAPCVVGSSAAAMDIIRGLFTVFGGAGDTTITILDGGVA